MADKFTIEKHQERMRQILLQPPTQQRNIIDTLLKSSRNKSRATRLRRPR